MSSPPRPYGVVARWHTDLRYVIRIFVTDLSKVKEIARLASRLFQNAEFYNIHGNLMMCDLPIIFNYNTRVVGGRGGGCLRRYIKNL